MKEKKYIDRLYQEKFRDFEASPRDEVWKSISKKLQEKEKKKPPVRPLWTRMAGIAALISLLMLIGDWFLQPQENAMVTAEEKVRRDQDGIVPPKEASVAVSGEAEERMPSGMEEGSLRATEIHGTRVPKHPVSESSAVRFSGIEISSAISGLSENPSPAPKPKKKLPRQERRIKDP